MPYLQENKWDGETKLSAREIYMCVNLHRYMRTCMHTYTCPGMQTYNGQIDAMQIAQTYAQILYVYIYIYTQTWSANRLQCNANTLQNKSK